MTFVESHIVCDDSIAKMARRYRVRTSVREYKDIK
jgi:hypothetical protein